MGDIHEMSVFVVIQSVPLYHGDYLVIQHGNNSGKPFTGLWIHKHIPCTMSALVCLMCVLHGEEHRGQQQRKHQNAALPNFCVGNSPVLGGSQHKRPVMWKVCRATNSPWHSRIKSICIMTHKRLSRAPHYNTQMLILTFGISSPIGWLWTIRSKADIYKSLQRR